MLDYMELVEGKRKVVCNSYISDKDNKVHNSFLIYEEEKLLMLATLKNSDFIGYNTKKFKAMPCNDFFNRFLAIGLDNFTAGSISTNINNLSYRSKNNFDFVIFVGNDIEVYCNAHSRYKSDNYRVQMKVFDKTFLISDLYGDNNSFVRIPYGLTKNFTKHDVLKTQDSLWLCDAIDDEDTGYVIVEEYGTKFKMCYDIYRRFSKCNSLLASGLLETGRLFKIHEDDKKVLAKKKLLFGDIIEIKYFENGYAVF